MLNAFHISLRLRVLAVKGMNCRVPDNYWESVVEFAF
jgi:hypothetical protein